MKQLWKIIWSTSARNLVKKLNVFLAGFDKNFPKFQNICFVQHIRLSSSIFVKGEVGFPTNFIIISWAVIIPLSCFGTSHFKHREIYNTKHVQMAVILQNMFDYIFDRIILNHSNLRYLWSIFSNFLTFLTRSISYLLRNTWTISKPEGNLSLAINIKISATTRTLISNTNTFPTTFQSIVHYFESIHKI